MSQATNDGEATRLIERLQAFVFGELHLSGADADAALRRLDELLPDLDPVTFQSGAE